MGKFQPPGLAPTSGQPICKSKYVECLGTPADPPPGFETDYDPNDNSKNYGWSTNGEGVILHLAALAEISNWLRNGVL